MKKLFMLLMLPLFGVQFGMAQSSETASDNKVFQVTGRLAEPFTGKIYLSYIKDRLENLDTVILENGTDFFLSELYLMLMFIGCVRVLICLTYPCWQNREGNTKLQ